MIEIGHHRSVELFGLSFHLDTIISMWIVSAVVIILALIINFLIKNRKNKPLSLLQVGAEMAIQTINDMPVSVMGKKGEKYAPFILGIFLFILFSNWFALIPVNAVYSMFFERWLGVIPEITAPTTDLNTTAGLAIIVFLSVHFIGLKEQGLKYFKKFTTPYFFFLPINILEEIAKPFSLAIRLFGNMFGKETILLILVSLVIFPAIYPVPVLMLSMFIGFIQAFIFALLTTFYIAGAITEGH